LVAALIAVMVVAAAAPAMAQFSFDTSNWEPVYTPAWCYDPVQTTDNQYVSRDYIDYYCGPGPVVR
jgi:hypothetical protein